MAPVRPELWRPQGVEDLEPRAWEALRENERSVCVTAGAGAGKTEFLAQKATYLLQTGICSYPRRILAISFKRDAARNLADRVAARCPPQQARRFVSMTFDAFTKHLLDHFRMALPLEYRPPADYEITFLTRDQIDAFLRKVGAPNIATQSLETAVARTALPLDEADITPLRRTVLQAYWREMYEGQDETLLTFPMINRLVDLMLRTNPLISKALRSTYPFVFLDEFQDTTYAQFELVRSAFDAGRTIFTAVGDDKQKIMGWAGAMRDSFDEFTAVFDARPISLLCNWRSHADLVAIQHVIAQRIDPNVEPAVAQQERLVDGDVAAIWEFDDCEDEIKALAVWIAREIETGQVAAHDIAVLARMRVDRVEDELAPQLGCHGIVLRNLARNVGSIAIQDLLAEELTAILLAFLRLGACRRHAQAWSTAQESLRQLESPAEDDDGVSQRRAADRVASITRSLREYMRDAEVAEAAIRPLLVLAVQQIGEPLLRLTSPSYQRDADFLRVIEGVAVLLEESVEDSETWVEALDRFEGVNQVPLMTIHKSKGLEFHTMIFFGLDSRNWRSLQPDADEELNAFFVAFTRAGQRAFFTFCRQRGGHIEWLEELLGDSVPRVALVP